jgi:hypothetical protein
MQPGCLTVAACFSAANLVQRKLVACTATAMTIPSGFSSFRDPIELEVLSDLSLRQVAAKSTSRTLGGWFIRPTSGLFVHLESPLNGDWETLARLSLLNLGPRVLSFG